MTQLNTWEIDGFLESKGGQLTVDGISAVDLAKEYGTPLFVFSESRIRHNIDRLKKAREAIDCPLKLCYAAKAMSTMGILRAVKDAGCDVEVNSGGELWKALEAGFTGDQINFNGNSKEVWELELAIVNDVFAIQVDSLYELSLIQETAKRLVKPANCSLRMVPEIESGTHSGLQTALLTSKFGMMPDEAYWAFAKYKDSEFLNLCGIHLHIGSQNPDPHVYSQALQALLSALQEIYYLTGNKLEHVNLGGGFPVNYSRANPEQPEHIQRLHEEIVSKGYIEATSPDGSAIRQQAPKHIIETFAREKMLRASYEPHSALGDAWAEVMSGASDDLRELVNGITLVLEPGRSIIADAGICLTTVRNVKQRPLTEINDALREAANKRSEESRRQERGVDSGKGSRTREHQSISFGIYDVRKGFVDDGSAAENWLLTDAGFNILLSMETYKWYYHMISAERAREPHDSPYKVAGPLCDGGDVYFDIEGEGRLPDYRMLPPEVQPGEVLAMLNAGAYTLAQASQYNARFLPAVVLVRASGEAELIRKRDRFADLITNDL
jgi:diaminopimelate decarboxylase